MQTLTPEGRQMVNDLSARHGFSADAVTHMVFAVLNGNGNAAQFSHSEFGGSGQWMRGGMVMIGDMFNNYLKGRVDALCSEISDILANQRGLLRSGSFQSQSQGGGSYQNQSTGRPIGNSSLFVPDPEDNWWPTELGDPGSVGSQNSVRYAYFPSACRLVVKTGNEVWVYNTLDHQIGGFSQQQGGGSSITFSSQFGTVDLSTLPVVSRNGQPVAAPAASTQPAVTPSCPANNFAASGSSTNSDNVFAAIEKLGWLKEKGIISDDEFASKKAELLNRI